MTIREAAAILGVLTVVLGWIVTHYLNRRRDRIADLNEKRRKYLEEQIRELYGPIYGLLMENSRVRHHVQRQLGRKVIFEGNRNLPQNEEEIWVHYLENYFLPNNRKILNIIRNNAHLIDGDKVPQSFLEFVDYATGYELFHKQYEEIGREYGFHYVENFPKNLRDDIIKTMTKLKRKQQNLVSREEM